LLNSKVFSCVSLLREWNSQKKIPQFSHLNQLLTIFLSLNIILYIILKKIYYFIFIIYYSIVHVIFSIFFPSRESILHFWYLSCKKTNSILKLVSTWHTCVLQLSTPVTPHVNIITDSLFKVQTNTTFFLSPFPK
jgi:uncharacterized membrane protein